MVRERRFDQMLLPTAHGMFRKTAPRTGSLLRAVGEGAENLQESDQSVPLFGSGTGASNLPSLHCTLQKVDELSGLDLHLVVHGRLEVTPHKVNGWRRLGQIHGVLLRDCDQRGS